MNRSLPDALHDDADLAAAIDASFGDGPPPPSLDGLLLAGRRARRRRTTTRVAIGGAVAAGVLVAVGVSTGSWDLTGAANSGVATTPSTTPSASAPGPSTGPEDGPPPLPASRELGVDFGPDGELLLREGTSVVRRIASPLADVGLERSYALVLERERQRYWVIAEWSPSGELISSDPAGKGFATFEDWVAYRVEASTGEEPDLVRLRPDGTLRPATGIELVTQVQDIDLGARFAAPGDRTAAAEVIDGNRRWYVLVRDSVGGTPDYITLDPAATAPTFEGFLDVAADIYSGRSEDAGEGLR